MALDPSSTGSVVAASEKEPPRALVPKAQINRLRTPHQMTRPEGELRMLVREMQTIRLCAKPDDHSTAQWEKLT